MGRKKSRFYNGILNIGSSYNITDLPKQECIDTNAPVLENKKNMVDTPGGSIIESVEAPSRMSKRKQKQFDKYLQKKLKKDARPELLARLQKSAFKADTLQSTKQLAVPVRYHNDGS